MVLGSGEFFHQYAFSKVLGGIVGDVENKTRLNVEKSDLDNFFIQAT